MRSWPAPLNVLPFTATGLPCLNSTSTYSALFGALLTGTVMA